MDIISQSALPVSFLDVAARHALGEATSGVSAGGGTSRIHLLDASLTNQKRAGDVLNHFGALRVTADKTTMTEGEADSVVSCHDAVIANDAELGYLALLDDEIYAQGRERVLSGRVSLTLDSPTAGVYVIYLYRRGGNYASGHVRITVRGDQR